ncbi:uncharacterized protein F5891DRAFT_1180280 [Suillus fuscotomentosus]|uniref:Uncharacterized protein n=1 Tax=Suillus fuscotomentosus TaxID=1912939 RepID=A0AAD4EMB3_9AGAM|nr:uncharacterized protein F5891DRAFT_1180280 [Suillus fuscotomentosus]KAG1908735.1 hypothetical protein F5891DRAFT_1180280 [Suillus fuscotomentosus]
MVASSGFYLVMSVISSSSIVLAVQVHPVKRSIVSSATCMSGYSWMDDSQGNSPCLTVAYVEGAYTGNDYNQPVLTSGYSYSLPNSSTANPCYCSWSSYNLMMACTLCQEVNNSAVWRQVIRLLASVGIGMRHEPIMGTGVRSSFIFVELRLRYLTDISLLDMYLLEMRPYLIGLLLIRQHGHTRYSISKMQTATYQKNSSSITPSASSLSSGSGSSPSSSSSSSKSTDVGAIVGGTIGGAAALSFLVIATYILYRRHVYRKGGYALAINQQGTTFIPSSHNRIPSDTSDLAPSVSGPLAMYGQSVSPSQQYQTAYLSPHGSSLPLPRMDLSVYTTHTGNGQRSDAVPMV